MHFKLDERHLNRKLEMSILLTEKKTAEDLKSKWYQFTLGAPP